MNKLTPLPVGICMKLKMLLIYRTKTGVGCHFLLPGILGIGIWGTISKKVPVINKYNMNDNNHIDNSGVGSSGSYYYFA